MSDVRPLCEMESRAPAVTRAVAVLEELAHTREPLGVPALSRRLGLAKSAVANLCAALEATRMVLSSRATPERAAALVADLNALAGQLARLVDLEHRERSR